MTATTPSAPAIWSAVAAWFAAVTALVVMLFQRRSLLEAARPELVLTDWKRHKAGSGDSERDVLSFDTVRNVGRGTALHIYMNAFGKRDDRPTYVMSTTRLPLLAAGEGEQVGCDISLWWDNVPADSAGNQYLPIHITIHAWDSRNRRHITDYRFLAVPLGGSQGVTDAIAPGVMLISRKVSTDSVWRLKLQRAWISILDKPKSLLNKWRQRRALPKPPGDSGDGA